MRKLRLRISLAVALLVLGVIGAALAPVVHRYHKLVTNLRPIRQSGATIQFDWGYDELSDIGTGPSAPKWARQLLGDEFFADPCGVSFQYTPVSEQALASMSRIDTITTIELVQCELEDEHLRWLSELPDLVNLSIQQTDITGEGFKHIQGLVELRDLQLSQNRLTDRSLRYLRPLNNLRSLRLDFNSITSDGLEAADIRSKRSLQRVTLSHTEVDDRALEQLESLPDLTFVTIFSTQVEPQAAIKFRQQRPDVDLGFN